MEAIRCNVFVNCRGQCSGRILNSASTGICEFQMTDANQIDPLSTDDASV